MGLRRCFAHSGLRQAPTCAGEFMLWMGAVTVMGAWVIAGSRAASSMRRSRGITALVAWDKLEKGRGGVRLGARLAYGA